MEDKLTRWKRLDKTRVALNRRRERLWIWTALALIVAVAINLFVQRLFPGARGTPLVLRAGSILLAIFIAVLCAWLNKRMLRENDRLCEEMDALAKELQKTNKQFTPRALRKQ